jgi:hypothetical protein
MSEHQVVRVACYVVTDIETDGPNPGANSMRSFASVAVDGAGQVTSTFEANLTELEGATPDPKTLAWFQSNPEAWRHATSNPRPANQVIKDYVAWIRALPQPRTFVAHPMGFDGFWMVWYLRRFEGELLVGLEPGDSLFNGGGIDLQSLVMGRLGWDYERCRRANYPAAWFGGYEHTHKAIDDAMGYANVLRTVLGLSFTSTSDGTQLTT